MNWEISMPTGTLRHYANKVARMRVREVVDRGSQLFNKRYDGMLSRLGYDFSACAAPAKASRAGQFFFNSNSIPSLLRILQERFPGQVDEIVCYADRILQHR